MASGWWQVDENSVLIDDLMVDDFDHLSIKKVCVDCKFFANCKFFWKLQQIGKGKWIFQNSVLLDDLMVDDFWPLIDKESLCQL